MDNYTIFTNNSIVVEFFEQKGLPVDVKWVAAPTIEVLNAARSSARLGAIILSNPLAGVRTASPLFSPINLPPTSGRATMKLSSINPYLTVLMSPPFDTVDFGSVQKIDEAIKLYKKNARLRFLAHNDEAIKNFQRSDLEITLTTMANLGNL